MLRPHFTRSRVGGLGLGLEEVHVRRLIGVLERELGVGKGKEGWTRKVDLQPLFFNLTLDSATEFLFGRSVDSQGAGLRGDGGGDGGGTREGRFGKAFDTCSRWLANRARMNEAFWVLDGREFRSSCAETHRYVDAIVDAAVEDRVAKGEEGGGAGETFLDSLLEQTDDRVKIRSELINILLAGRDTTAGLLGWLFYALVRHQGVYVKLRNIILDEFGAYEDSENITLAKLKDCQYLQFCLNEALRLYPPVPANTRQALRDTTLPSGGGPDGKGRIFVRKDQQVNYTVYALHRWEEFWGADADEFKPERWLGRKFGWEYLPFNGGPRICLGRKFFDFPLFPPKKRNCKFCTPPADEAQNANLAFFLHRI